MSSEYTYTIGDAPLLIPKPITVLADACSSQCVITATNPGHSWFTETPTEFMIETDLVSLLGI